MEMEPEALILRDRVWITRAEMEQLPLPVLSSLQAIFAKQMSVLSEVGISLKEIQRL